MGHEQELVEDLLRRGARAVDAGLHEVGDAPLALCLSDREKRRERIERPHDVLRRVEVPLVRGRQAFEAPREGLDGAEGAHGAEADHACPLRVRVRVVEPPEEPLLADAIPADERGGGEEGEEREGAREEDAP